jgi:hypothetical protein
MHQPLHVKVENAVPASFPLHQFNEKGHVLNLRGYGPVTALFSLEQLSPWSNPAWLDIFLRVLQDHHT